MKRKNLFGLLLSLIIGVMILAACQPREVVVTQEVIVTQEVEREVIVTQEVEVRVVETVEVPVELEAGPQGEIVVSLTTFPNALDIPQAAERNASTAGWHLFNSLVWVNQDKEVVPDLAESWTISDDGTEYTFNLREDVVFHNGEPFNADAVVFSWERASNAGFEYSNFWQGATSVEKVDDYTVKITLAEPQPTFLFILNEYWNMVPPGYISEVGEEGFTEHPIGTGPYMFVEWVKGDRIVMEANPNYHEEPGPLIQRVIFRPIPESSTRVAAVQTGEIDIAKRLSAEEAQSLLGVPNVQVVSYPADRVYYIAFNNLTTGVGLPTLDPRVRQAMNYAVDRQAIVDALFNGYARLSTSYVTPANFGFNPEIEPFPYDPDMSLQLLSDAGYPNGFEIEFRCPIGAYTNFEQVCEAVQGYLADVGIVSNLEFMESGAYWDLEANKELPGIFGDSWSNALPEPIARIEGALGLDASYAAWNTPEITALINGMKTT
ncbi:MAG TPA: ABC transporter substrate-binding protein, partial [Anaerolineales bacterium]|nr:ABC transporter substrate-binding protein [Anaerolineales bacterium]